MECTERRRKGRIPDGRIHPRIKSLSHGERKRRMRRTVGSVEKKRANVGRIARSGGLFYRRSQLVLHSLLECDSENGLYDSGKKKTEVLRNMRNVSLTF